MELPKNLKITLNYFNILEKQFDIDKIINVYFYGSYLYGTFNKKSDYDYIAIYDQDIDVSDTIKIDFPVKMNITLMSPKYFKKRIKNHNIDVLECIFTDDKYKLEQIKFDFKLNKDKLRRSISAVCSNSYVKCKKKLVQGDDYIGKKSLFHSLRIADYGIQIAKNSKIVSFDNCYSETLKDYKTFKNLFDEIMTFNTWNELNEKYKHIANNIRTEFRKYAPLNNE